MANFLIDHEYTLDITPSARPQLVPVSEYDVGRIFTFTLKHNGQEMTIPSSYGAVTVEGTIGSYAFSESASIENGKIVFQLTESMTAHAGKAWTKIKFANADAPVSSCAFILAVDRAGVEADTVIGADGFDTQVQNAVDDWFEENPPDYGIDDTLTISGDAADAKTVGDALTAVIGEPYSSGDSGGGGDDTGTDLADDFTYTEGKVINAEGVESDNSASKIVNYFAVEEGVTYKFVFNPSTAQSTNTRVHGYYSNKTWKEQLVLIATNSLDESTTYITIPTGVAWVRISINANHTITEFSESAFPPNLASSFSFTIGNYIDSSGAEASGESFKCTGFVSVDSGDYLFVYKSINNTITRVYGYDSAYNPVRELYSLLAVDGDYAQKSATITITSTVKYIRVSSHKSVNAQSFESKSRSGGDSGGDDEYDNLINLTQRVTALEEEIQPEPISTEKNILVGSPYAYLSATIEDEILDSKTCADVYAIYDDLVANHPETFVRLSDIGTETSQNLPIRMYRMKWTTPFVTATEASWNQSDNIYQSSYDKYRRLFISSGTHGNEKSSVYGVALAIKEILESDSEFAKYIRANFAIDLVPIVNPAGFNATTRNNGSNVNINRDFLTRNTAEAQAVYNVLTSNEYYACIDSHNSGGNANYLGIPNTNPRYKDYIQVGMKFGQIVYNDWKTLCTGEQYAVSPYMQFWLHTPNAGMMQDLFTELGLVGWLIETVGVFASSIGTLTPNHKKYCKFTKDLLINSIICLGTNEWN